MLAVRRELLQQVGIAFEVLEHEETHGDAGVRAHLVAELAKAAGAQGMVGGQMLDLLAEEKEPSAMSIGAITRLQRLKTGALISFSCTAGAILGKAAEPSRNALSATQYFAIPPDRVVELGMQMSV